MTTLQLSLLTIRAADIERSARFYEALGLSFVQHRHGTGPLHYSCARDGLVFEIYPLLSGDSPTHSARLGFRVSDMATATQRLVAAGGMVVSRPRMTEWGERCVVEDPDRHRIELEAEAA